MSSSSDQSDQSESSSDLEGIDDFVSSESDQSESELLRRAPSIKSPLLPLRSLNIESDEDEYTASSLDGIDLDDSDGEDLPDPNVYTPFDDEPVQKKQVKVTIAVSKDEPKTEDLVIPRGPADTDEFYELKSKLTKRILAQGYSSDDSLKIASMIAQKVQYGVAYEDSDEKLMIKVLKEIA